MADIYMALIDLEDYEAFRVVLKSHIPNTHDEWLARRFNERAQTEKMHGIHLVEVKIRPQDFVAFITSNRMDANLKSLDFCASKQSVIENKLSTPST